MTVEPSDEPAPSDPADSWVNPGGTPANATPTTPAALSTTAAPPTPSDTWLPGEVPDAIGPPPRLEDVRDDVERSWLAPAGEAATGSGPAPPGASGTSDAVALIAVAVAAVVLVLARMVPVARRVAQLAPDGLADPGVVPALVALGLVLAIGVWVFVRVLRRRTPESRPAAARSRHRVLAWTWASAVVLLAVTRVTGPFPVFGDPVDGALEEHPSGSILGVEEPKALAIWLIWACLYGLVVTPALALLFSWLSARGRLDGVEVVLTRSGPVLQSTPLPETPAGMAGPVERAEGVDA